LFFGILYLFFFGIKYLFLFLGFDIYFFTFTSNIYFLDLMIEKKEEILQMEMIDSLVD
jgi:hypothetical protein